MTIKLKLNMKCQISLPVSGFKVTGSWNRGSGMELLHRKLFAEFFCSINVEPNLIKLPVSEV